MGRDVDISLKINSVPTTNGAAGPGAIGLMMRGDYRQHIQACIAIGATQANDYRQIYRDTVGNSGVSISAGAFVSPGYVRLVRSGTSFYSYYSTNNSTWTQVGPPVTIAMNANYLIGIAASGDAPDGTGSGQVDDFTVLNGSCSTGCHPGISAITYNGNGAGDDIVQIYNPLQRLPGHQQLAHRGPRAGCASTDVTLFAFPHGQPGIGRRGAFRLVATAKALTIPRQLCGGQPAGRLQHPGQLRQHAPRHRPGQRRQHHRRPDWLGHHQLRRDRRWPRPWPT